jgi:gluconolactonase
MSFRTYHPSFKAILGQSPRIECLKEKDYAFAHEAGVFIAETNELFITSNRLVDASGHQEIRISRVKLGETSAATTCDEIECAEVVMGNGGVNYGRDILFCAQGNTVAPSGIYQVSASPPYASKLVVAGFHGRPFNSLNDVVVHGDGSIWFTDPTYGYEQGYRPKPRLPSQVYRFSPIDGSIRAMADGFGHPNGLCFSPDESKLYVTDTDWISGDGTTDDTKASTM